MVEELFRLYPERRTDWPAQNMLGKLSKPEDFRGAAVFLLSPASSYMTGADLRIGTYNSELMLPIWDRSWVARLVPGARGPRPVVPPQVLPWMSDANAEICVDGGHASW